MKKILLLTSLTFVLFSCSNKELDRGMAFDIIEEFYDYPNVEIVNFQGVTSSQKLNNEYRNLRGQKFITEKRKGKYGNEFWVLMTEKGKSFTLSGKPNYNGYKVASSILELDEVTGIRLDDGKNTAYVDYTVKRKKVTPFGNTKDYNDGDILEKKTVMQLYDDGWRITGKKEGEIVKEENVKGFDKNYLNDLSKISSEITMETTQSPCLIKNVYEKYGQTFITVDFIQRKWVEQDGMEGFEILNTNPKLRTFVINSSSELIPNLKAEELKKYIPTDDYKQDFDITVENGNVVRLQRNDAG